MLRLPAAAVETLLATLNGWVGAELAISESISRARDGGHDRHFATLTTFRMTLEYAVVTFSGLNLSLGGAGRTGYQVAVERLVAIEYPDDRSVILIEQFEQRTERLTRLRRSAPPDPGFESPANKL